jgi:hypothetical protein
MRLLCTGLSQVLVRLLCQFGVFPRVEAWPVPAVNVPTPAVSAYKSASFVTARELNMRVGNSSRGQASVYAETIAEDSR